MMNTPMRLMVLLCLCLVLAVPVQAARISSGGGAGSGTVTSVDAANGVETVSGSAISATGTIRGAVTVNAQTGTTYTYLTGDRGKLVTHTNASAIAGTLPQASASFPSGWYMDVQNRGAGTLTITPTTSTIDGAATLALTTNQGVRIFSDGTNYFSQRGIGSSSGAPSTATYITQTADGGLSAEQALGSLATGCMASTTTTGVVATRTITGTANQITVTNGDCSGAPTISIPTNPTLPGNVSVTGTLSTGSGGGTTGSVALSGATSGGITITPAAASGQIITLTNAAQTSGAASITIPDLAGVSQTPTFNTLAATLTNKTLDAEGTGNVLSIPVKRWYPAAGCNNATAGSVWDLPTSTPAVAACVTGSNIQKGVLQFADTSGGFIAQITDALPADWTSTGGIDINLYWTTTATSGNAKWSVSTACTDVAASMTDDPAFNTANTVTTAAPGTASRVQTSTITGLTTTGCTTATRMLLHLKLFRDGNDAADTIGASANFLGALLTYRRAM